MALCLVVEDQPLQRKTVMATLREAGYQVLGCGSGAQALARCQEHRPEAILLDLGLPDVDGLDLIPELLERAPLARILVLTGHDNVTEAVTALRAGARHYLVKPWDREELLLVLEREVRALNREETLKRESGSEIFWGAGAQVHTLREHLGRLAAAPDTPVLVLGGTGTGKEVVARELHRLTAASRPFVAVNCSAVPAELMESELFGHERGAFTGAECRRRGVVELADGGTLFLDEVADMAPRLQAKLLRFLQDGSFRRLGSEAELTSGCRVVAATQADVDGLREQGGFREDLYFRLAVVRLHLPALRDRQEDMLPLANFLIERIARRLGKPLKPLSPRSEIAMLGHPWPGNIRELANRIERALVLGAGAQIEPEDLDLSRIDSPLTAAGDILGDAARLRLLLETEGWNLSAVARRLGVERHRVKYRIGKLGLQRPDTN